MDNKENSFITPANKLYSLDNLVILGDFEEVESYYDKKEDGKYQYLIRIFKNLNNNKLYKFIEKRDGEEVVSVENCGMV